MVDRRQRVSGFRHRAVVFDLFGTLVTYPPGAQHVRSMAARIGVPFEQLHSSWRKLRAQRDAGDLDTLGALRLCCVALGIERSDEHLVAACADLTAFFQGLLTPRDGAIATLTALRDGGLRIGLVSDANIETSRLWPASPMARYVETAVFSSVERVRKPDPSLYRAVCERLAVEGRECLYVGNGDGDELAGATKAGMSVVLFTAPGEEPGREAAAWPGPRIAHLSEVLAFVDGSK